MVAKVTGGIIGLGLISTGGIAMTKPHWLGMDYMPEWHPLSGDNSFDTSGYSGKFGDEYKNYLVGVTHKKNGQNNETSEYWWEWAYRRLQEDDVKEGAFKLNKKVKGGFKTGTAEANNPKSLSQVCDDAYKADNNNVKADGNNTNEFNKEHVWKYCSPLGASPKTIQEKTGEDNDYSTSDSQNSIGKTKASELLSVKHPDNQKLWELKNDEFFGRGVFKSATTPSDAFFKALFDEKNSNMDKYALKNKCLAAYKTTSKGTATSTEPKADDVVKYCSTKSIK